MLQGLTPELAATPPLPHGVLVDQLGATLALIAGEAAAAAIPDLLNRVRQCIRERCSEPQLTADDVATALDIPARDLHRVLAGANQTFASLLLDERVDVAVQMLTSRSFRQRSIREIAAEAGFLMVSHFARAVRKRTGQTPMELRCATS
jgi:AraC-like DNA-binding protein